MAAKLLPDDRVAHCHRSAAGAVVSVTCCCGHSSYRNVQTCASVWTCPVCSAKISATRRDELNTLLRWARPLELVPVLLTLTGHHNNRTSLTAALQVMKAAKKSMHQSRAWTDSVGPLVEGHVTATEVNKSRRHGWHVHYHIVVLVDANNEAAAMAALEPLREAWLRALERQGSWGGEHAFDLRGAAEAGSYVGKWGAAEELALTGAKQARGDADIKGMTPWELLAAAADGDELAGLSFIEYAEAFHGRRQLVWSRGLKARAGLRDLTDQDLADGEQPEDDEVEDTCEVVVFPKRVWRRVVWARLRVQVLEAASAGGYEAVVDLLRRHHISGAMPGGWRPGVNPEFAMAA